MTSKRAALGLLVVLLCTGCAAEGDEKVVAFCQGATALAEGSPLDGLDFTDIEGMTSDDPALAAATDAGAALGALEVPREVAEQWRTVVEPLGALLRALRTVDRSSPSFPDDLRAATDALAAPEVVAAGAAVDAYAAEHC